MELGGLRLVRQVLLLVVALVDVRRHHVVLPLIGVADLLTLGAAPAVVQPLVLVVRELYEVILALEGLGSVRGCAAAAAVDLELTDLSGLMNFERWDVWRMLVCRVQ